jgi:ABC-type uncharacterized transport system permease subunit
MPLSLFLVVACVLGYLLGTYLLLRQSRTPQLKHSHRTITLLAAVAIALHAVILYRSMFADGEATISLGLAISMAGWISAFIYLAFTMQEKVVDLGLIVLPMGMLAMILGMVITGTSMPLSQLPQGVIWHIVLAIPTYGILCLAFAQACLLIFQDRQLHNPGGAGQLIALPAIQTMESFLFWFTLAGFILMTINLVAGMVSSFSRYGQPLEFNHHVVLSILAWICFGSLLAGRKIAGWRGEIAAKWTIIAFTILVLAYFGTRFVNDFVLNS